MTAKVQKRWRTVLLAVSAVLTFILTVAASHQKPEKQEVVKPVSHSQHLEVATAPSEPIPDIHLKPITREKTAAATGKLFQPKSWYVPPPPPPPAPPPAPTAPPLPFTFLGKVENPDGTLTIFLSGHDRVYLVKEDDTIDGTYRVEGIKNGQITLTYLPLQIQQSLPIGDTP